MVYADKHKLHERERTLGSDRLATLVIDVTPRCNMRCEHCYAFLDVKPVELEFVGKALAEAYEMGVSHYVLMGGEPILDRKRMEFILENCHADESYINVTSNGWHLTRERIQWLKRFGVDKVSVSMDSGIPEEHDQSRRFGSFERVMGVIDDVLEEGLIVSIDVVVTHESLYSEGFRKAYDIAISKGIRLDLQIAEPVGNWEGRKDVLITPEDAAYIKELRAKSPPTAQGDPTIRRDIYSRGGEDHCPAGTGFMHITADGNVLPCNFLQYSLGSIRDRSLREMRDDLLEHPLFSSRSTPLCLCGEDTEFIDEYIMPHVGEPKPLDAYEVFGLRRSEKK